MIRALRAIRMGALQLAAVTSLSLTATVLIIVNATGQTPLDSAVIAAVGHRVVVHRLAAVRPVSSDPSSGGGSSSSQSGGSGGSGSGSGGGSGATGGSSASSTTPAQTATTTSTPTTTPPPPKASRIKHVFVITLSTPSYAAAFGKGSVAAYLNGTLRKRGTLLSGYQTLAASSELADELATVSGQAPNTDTRAGCSAYSEFPSSAKAAANGQVRGAGCIYPDTALTIGDQITSAGLQWKAYVDDMGATPCVHPNSNAADNARLPGAGAQYDTRHNPFIYFHSLLDLGDCATDDVSLDQLSRNLGSASKTPSYAYIAPGSCDDASVTPAAGSATPATTTPTTTPTPVTTCPAATPTGLAGEDAFLKAWVPLILRSPAYKKDGALIIAFATPGPTASRAGALVLSKYAPADQAITTGYDSYSLLRTVEDIFGFKPLAHAKAAKSFADLFAKGT